VKKWIYKEIQMILYKFSAPWSEVSNRMDGVLAQLMVDYPQVTYININGEDPLFAELRVKCSVRTLPSFILYDNGATIDRVEGEFSLEQGKNWLDDQLGITLAKERLGKLPKKE
jgi:thioredoxin-like negative regulator of GroEL